MSLTENLTPDGCVNRYRQQHGVTRDTQEGKSVPKGGEVDRLS